MVADSILVVADSILVVADSWSLIRGVLIQPPGRWFGVFSK